MFTKHDRILVGTMRSMEREFDDCVKAVAEQKGVQLEHFVIENKSHQEAHEILYRTFMQNSNRFDIFVKVDADMVLTRDDLFFQIGQRFTTNPEMDCLTIGIQDFFTNRLISGLHSWRRTVRWGERDPVYPDNSSVPNKRHIYDYHDLAPAAFHCPNPSDIQAFRYGVTRALKFVVGWYRGWWNEETLGFVRDTWLHFYRQRDRRLALACLGAEFAFSGKVTAKHLDYAYPHLQILVAKYSSWPLKRTSRYARLLRLCNRLRKPYLLFSGNSRCVHMTLKSKHLFNRFRHSFQADRFIDAI